MGDFNAITSFREKEGCWFMVPNHVMTNIVLKCLMCVLVFWDNTKQNISPYALKYITRKQISLNELGDKLEVLKCSKYVSKSNMKFWTEKLNPILSYDKK